MDIKPIRTDADYEAAVLEIEKLWEAPPGSPEADKLDILGTLVVAYQEKHHPIALPDPVTAIRFRMEQQGLKRKDLEPYLGGRSHVSEVLSGERSLSLSMIRKLNKGLGIPLEVLVQEVPRVRRKPATRTVAQSSHVPVPELNRAPEKKRKSDGSRKVPPPSTYTPLQK